MTGRTDVATRTIPATPQALYRAMVDPDALCHWLPPAGMTGDMLAFDLRPNGHYRMALRYDDTSIVGKSGGNADIVEARFVALAPDESVIQAIDFISDDPRFAGTMTMHWLLRPVSDGTEVTIRAENVPEGINAHDHAEGLNASLDNLAVYVSQHP